MAKLVYNEDLLNEAILKLNEAQRYMSNNISSFSSAANMISRARGSNYLDLSGLTQIQKTYEECITTAGQMADLIDSKIEYIKEYNGEQDHIKWYERIFPTLGLAATKIGEGFLTAGEQIVDGFASAIGWLAGKTGNQESQDKIAAFVSKDYVGDLFDHIYYETDFGQNMLKYSAIREDGKVAGVFKLVGTAAGYYTAIALTGGVAGAIGGSGAAAGAAAATHSLGINMLAAGIGATGGTTQAGLQSGLDYDKAFGQGVKAGIISAATVFAVNKLAGAISKGIKNIRANRAAGSADDIIDDLVPSNKPPGGGGSGGGGGGGSTGGSPTGGAGKTAAKAGDTFSSAASKTGTSVGPNDGIILDKNGKAIAKISDMFVDDVTDDFLTTTTRAGDTFSSAASKSGGQAVKALTGRVADVTDDTLVNAASSTTKALPGATTGSSTAAGAANAGKTASDSFVSKISDIFDDNMDEWLNINSSTGSGFTSSGGGAATPKGGSFWEPQVQPMGAAESSAGAAVTFKEPIKLGIFDIFKEAPQGGSLVPINQAQGLVANTGGAVSAASKATGDLVGSTAGILAETSAGEVASQALVPITTQALAPLTGALTSAASSTATQLAGKVAEETTKKVAFPILSSATAALLNSPKAELEPVAADVDLVSLKTAELPKVQTLTKTETAVAPKLELKTYEQPETVVKTPQQQYQGERTTIPPVVGTRTGTGGGSGGGGTPTSSERPTTAPVIPVPPTTPPSIPPTVPPVETIDDVFPTQPVVAMETLPVQAATDPITADTGNDNPDSGGGGSDSGGGGGGSDSGGGGGGGSDTTPTTPKITTPVTTPKTTPATTPKTTPKTIPTESTPVNPIQNREVEQTDDTKQTTSSGGGGGGGSAKVDEYSAIPNTGINKKTSVTDYVLPLGIGLTAGLAGMGVKALSKNKKHEDDEDDDEDSEYFRFDDEDDEIPSIDNTEYY